MRYRRIMLLCAAVFMIGINIALYIQYRFFCEQSQRVVALRQEYQTHIEAVQNILDEYALEKIALHEEQEEAALPALAFESAQPEQPIEHIVRKEQQEFELTWPLDKENFWISSYFGMRKKPDGSHKFHYGVDMAALQGTPVYAAGAGRVVESREASWGYGNTIVIAHDKKYKTRYAHLHKILVRIGQQVAGGDVIGQVGSTGSVHKAGKDASHLHFEVSVAGQRANPMDYLIS